MTWSLSGRSSKTYLKYVLYPDWSAVTTDHRLLRDDQQRVCALHKGAPWHCRTLVENKGWVCQCSRSKGSVTQKMLWWGLLQTPPDQTSPDQEDVEGEAFYRQLQMSPACKCLSSWENSAIEIVILGPALCKQSKKFLNYVGDNVIMQMVKGLYLTCCS